MDFISGFLGLCSAVGVGTATEIAAPGYSRQAIRFSDAVSGAAVNSNGYDFGNVEVAPVAGRAIYDAPTGGNLLLVLPHQQPRPPQGGSIDRGEAGYLTIIFSALASYPTSSAFSGSFAPGSSLGSCYDLSEIIGLTSTQPNIVAGVTVLARGGQFLQVFASTLSAGVTLTVSRGLLAG